MLGYIKKVSYEMTGNPVKETNSFVCMRKYRCKSCIYEMFSFSYNSHEFCYVASIIVRFFVITVLHVNWIRNRFSPFAILEVGI